MIRCRTVRQLSVEERWEKEFVLSIKETPWSPEGERAGDVNIRVDLREARGDRGAHPPDVDPPIIPHQRDVREVWSHRQTFGCCAKRLSTNSRKSLKELPRSIVADIEELENSDASEIHAPKLNAKEVIHADKIVNFSCSRSQMEQLNCLEEIRLSEKMTVKPNDFWTIAGIFFIFITLNQDLNSLCSRKNHSQCHLNILDVVRRTNSTSHVLQERETDEDWNVDGDRNLSDPWTGFTQFTRKKKKPPDGYTWYGERLTKVQATSRPDQLWSEIWSAMGYREPCDRLCEKVERHLFC